MKDIRYYIDKEEEIERDLDDLENSRRDICDEEYRKIRKRILARRRYNNNRIVEIEARVN